MRAGRMPGDVDLIWIAAEARGVFVDPCYCGANLLRHWHEAAAGILDLHEVWYHPMSAGIDEHFGQISRVLCLAVAPRAAVNEDINRRIPTASFVNVELLDLRRTVGHSFGLSEPFQCCFTGKLSPESD